MRLVITSFVFAALALTGKDADVAALLSPQQEWRWMTLTGSSGVPDGRVIAMESDGDGVVWVGTDRGLAWYDGYQFLPPSSEQGSWPGGEIRRIVRTDNGDIAIHSAGDIWVGRGGKLRRVNNRPGAVGGIAPLGGNALYAVTGAGHFRLQGDRWTPVIPAEKPGRVFPGRNGKPWLVTTGAGLRHWQGDGWSKTLPGITGDMIATLAETAGLLAFSISAPGKVSGLWEIDLSGTPKVLRRGRDLARLISFGPKGEGIATFESGDVQLRIDGVWQSLDDSFSGTLLRRTASLYFHPNGDVWAGTNGIINVFRTAPQPLRQMSFPHGDGHNNVHEILRRKNGELWLATSEGLLTQSPGGQWKKISSIGDKPIGVATGLSEDSAGNVWISSGSSFGGAYRFSEGNWRHFGKAESLTDWPIHRIRRDGAGRLWMLSNQASLQGKPEESGAFVWDGQNFQVFGKARGMPDPAVTSFAQAPDGALWFSTKSGLTRYDGGKWEHYTDSSGLKALRTFDLSVGSDGAVWFCHQRAPLGVGRLVRRADGSAETQYFKEQDGLPSNEVWAVYAEPDGRVWASTANGVGVYRGGPWVSAGMGYGIEGIRTWALLLEEDSLWLGTLGQGLFRISRSERMDAHPRLFFQPLAQGDDHWTLGWRALAKRGSIRPADILTRHRVDGGPWERWGAVRSHSIPVTNPGRHWVEVQAVGALGDVDENAASFSFSIPYPLYLQPAFLGFVAILAMAAGAFAFQALRSRWRYTRELEVAKQKAEDSGKARSAFLAVMSHEIRTPMNGVLGMTTVMLDTPLDRRQRTYMETIRNSAEALLSVINDVLDFSKIESGTFQITLAPFDLEDVCEQVATLLAARAGEKGLLLIVDYPVNAPRLVVGDSGRVRQILLNLAGNAIKFTECGSVRITVSVAARANKHTLLRIGVKDTGIGIAAEKLPELFREFSQVDSSAARRHGGTGLGLAISKKLAEHMNGMLTVESVLGNGSTFTCEIPFLNADPASAMTPMVGRCLILHPDPVIRETLALFTRELGLLAKALPSPDRLPEETFQFVLTARQWAGAVGAPLSRGGATVLPIEADASSTTPPLLPLSRHRLRDALLTTDSGVATVTEPAGDRGPIFHGRVLVVEDNQTNQRVVRLLLEKLGCSVVVAGDGAQALQLCQLQEFDMIFMDMQMPVMDGLEATRRLRQVASPCARVPILALTANAMEEDRQRCVEAGMSGYLVKPIVREELIAALRAYLPAQHTGLAR